MSFVQQNNPLRLNTDKHPKNLDASESTFLLNHERNRDGYGGLSTPLTGNYPFGSISQPVGENYTNGTCEVKELNEVYDWVYNSNNQHYIKRISDTNGLQVVYDRDELFLSADPKHFIAPSRCKLRLDNIYDKGDNLSCKNRHGKVLLWTDSLYDIGCLDVEASIATNSFRTPFFDISPDYASLIRLCVPEPSKVLVGDFVPRSGTDDGLSNKILDIGFKFIYRWIYYDGRKSEWSTPSTMYYQSKQGCFDNIDAFPRCINLRVPIGNPQVEKIEVAFNKGDVGEGNTDIYLSYEIIEKYKKYNSTQQYWYERDLSEVVTGNNFREDDWSFDYAFCNDKNCNPVETPRIYNPMPRQPQGFFTIKDAEAYYNYIQGNCPIDQFQIEKFNLSVDCEDEGCERELVEVKVRLVIREANFETIGYVYRKEGVFGERGDNFTDTVYYGGNNGDIDDEAEQLPNRALGQPFYGQEFTDAKNFTVYVEGTGYFAEMKQFKADNYFQNTQEYGTLAGFAPIDGSSDSNPNVILWARNLTQRGFFYQEATLKLPKGIRGVIRVRSNTARLNNGDTSAAVIGTLPINQLTTGINSGLARDIYVSNLQSIYENGVHEIPFDTCNVEDGLLEINDAFIVDSVSYPGKFYYVFHGVISDTNNKPVPGLELRSDDGTRLLATTDHNGFYSFSYDKLSQSNGPVSVGIYGERDCGNFQPLQNFGFIGVLNVDTEYNIKLVDTVYTEQFYETVRVTVKDCDGSPARGVRVALTGEKYQVTDDVTGIATFKVRNYSSRAREVQGFVMDAKGCFNYDCSGQCGFCYPQTNPVVLSSCFISTPSIDIAVTTPINIERVTNQGKGLKSGGRYAMGFVVKGDCGRISAVNKVSFLDIPKTQVKGNDGLCSLRYDATGMVLPDWAKSLMIVRSENINQFELQWVVDSFEKTSGNKIKITIQSLNDYNALYGAQTNTTYQWLKGDRVEFIKDNDGEILPASQYGILNYLTLSPFHDTDLSGVTTADANYLNQLLIEDDGKIDFLKAGAVIEIQRPKECTTEPTYFSVGVELQVSNGQLVEPVGQFFTFDTYIQKRIINNGALISFEHHSPSDFWGNRLSDVGRPYFPNEFENEKRLGKNITVASPTQINYFGDVVKVVDGVGGDIIAMTIKDGQIIQIIGQTDNTLAQASDDLLRVSPDGIIRAAAPDSVISDGEPKLSGEYGCRYEDIGGIYFGDGFTNWYDIRFYSYVNSNYSITKSISENKVDRYFRHIGMLLSANNKNEQNPLSKLRLRTGYNVQTKAVSLTIKALRDAGVFNENNQYTTQNTTILYHNDSEDFVTYASYTPEAYSNMILNDGFGAAMITYFNGQPYIHPFNPSNYNEFFGAAVDRVATIAINKFPDKIKVPLSYELQSNMMWFVQNVETSDPNFSSEIPPIRVKKNLNKWNAAFLKNKNSRKGLFEGDPPRDYYALVTFKRDNTNELRYGSINNQKRIIFDTLGFIIFTFITTEQSGFTAQQG